MSNYVEINLFFLIKIGFYSGSESLIDWLIDWWDTLFQF